MGRIAGGIQGHWGSAVVEWSREKEFGSLVGTQKALDRFK